MTVTLQLRGICKSFVQGGQKLPILNGLNMSIAEGQIVALVGPSGSGKTTLLQMAGLLSQPDAGNIQILGQACEHLNEAQRTVMRRDHIGFVYQFHHLLPELSALENIMMPALLRGVAKSEANAMAADLLSDVGLTARASHRPSELSGGEQQRVAIARALANKPALVLADEPTGNLDPTTSAMVMEMLRERLRRHGASALIVTHNHELAQSMDAVLRLRDGQIIADA